MGLTPRSRVISSVAAAGAAEVAPLRVGATLSETVGPAATPLTATISARGDINVGDTVFHDIAVTSPAAATQYTVDAVSAGSITVSWTGGGDRTITTAKILSPGNHTRGIIQVVGYQLSTTVNLGTFQFASNVTALTGVQGMVTNRPHTARPGFIPICSSVPNQMLYVLATVGALNGWVVYTRS